MGGSSNTVEIPSFLVCIKHVCKSEIKQHELLIVNSSDSSEGARKSRQSDKEQLNLSAINTQGNTRV